jgi:hypothetical protein
MPQDDEPVPPEPPMPDIAWDIRRNGRRWSEAEAMGRFDLTPEKFEMIDGRLFWSERDRLVLLALLLENAGADQAVRLGGAEVWRAAVEEVT